MYDLPLFFNTLEEEEKELRVSVDAAGRQERKILRFFREHPNGSYTPSYIYKRLFSDDTPITSVRRAITSLTMKGVLEKTSEQEEGLYGKLNFKWRLK